MSSSKVPPKKPVNDLIKFWAAQQEEKEKSGSDLRAPKRPLSPNTSAPSSPKQPLSPRQRNFRDTPTSSPPLSPTKNNINRSIKDTTQISNGDNTQLQISINDFSSKDAESSSSSYVTFVKERFDILI
jgi:hypothetical protein